MRHAPAGRSRTKPSGRGRMRNLSIASPIGRRTAGNSKRAAATARCSTTTVKGTSGRADSREPEGLPGLVQGIGCRGFEEEARRPASGFRARCPRSRDAGTRLRARWPWRGASSRRGAASQAHAGARRDESPPDVPNRPLPRAPHPSTRGSTRSSGGSRRPARGRSAKFEEVDLVVLVASAFHPAHGLLQRLDPPGSGALCSARPSAPRNARSAVTTGVSALAMSLVPFGR